MSVTAQRAAVGVLALLMATQAFGAVTFTVNSNADLIDKDIGDGVCLTDVNTCTLRAAVMQANVTAIDSTIQLPANTYTLVRPALGANGADQGDLNLAPPLSGSPTITIAGAGAATTIIDANGIDRVLSVESLRYAIISGVTVTHGVVSGRDGGGIYNSGILTLRDSIVSYNSVLQNRAGGGIYTTEAMTLTRVTLDHNQVNGNGGAISNNNYLGVYQSTLSNNMASDHGGGIYHDGGSLSTMVGSTLSNNTAGGNGGAIYNAASKSLSLDFCTVSGNHALGVHGGGIWSDSSSSLTLDHSTLSGNTAAFSGGAIEMYVGSQLALGNSTLSGNSAGYSGGGLFAYRAYASIVNTTIAFNSANNSGGGISSAGTISGGSTVNVSSSTIAYNQADSDADSVGNGAGVQIESTSFINIRNSVLAGNYLAGQPDYSDCAGKLGIYGNNRLGTGSGCTAAAGSSGYVGTLGSLNELGNLGNNCGPTKTMALVAPSDMIDGAIDCIDSVGQPLTTDQRGAPRVSGAYCDIGAYEYGGVVSEVEFKDGFE